MSGSSCGQSARLSLAEHPRLYLGPEQVKRASSPRESDLLQRVAEQVAAQADEYAGDPGFDELPATHNAHLIRARWMQTRVVTLIVQWLRTNERRYRDSAVAHLDTMDRWEYWSWLAWRQNDPRPEAIFDLSYGENSATLALGYDLLYHDLTEAERSALRETAVRRSLDPFLHVLAHESPSWFRRPDSNWNTVCTGGAGMLALAMYEELDQAPAVLAKAEESVEPFMRTLEHTSGGWPEGIGYWNYGMRYAFMYLLSHEQATGRPHPLLRAEPTRQTLAFPLDFCPHGQPCSFGDVNRWSPLPFHYAVAERLGDVPVLAGLEAAIAAEPVATDRVTRWQTSHWPVAAETLLLYPHRTPSDETRGGPADTAESTQSRDSAEFNGQAKLYAGLGWVRLADRWPDPRLYLAIRGGTTEVPHNHLDLLSFHAVVGNERLIENLTPAEYLDTTFGSRRFELFEMVPQSKNVPLINGVGITNPASAEPELVNVGGDPGVRMDATEAMGWGRGDGPLATFCGRLFVLLGHRAALILDRIDLHHNGRAEIRLHTRAEVTTDGDRVLLTGKRQRLTVSFAANLPFTLTTARTVPTTPGDEATALRWCGPRELGKHFLMATLLVPGETTAGVTLASTPDGVTADVQAGDWSTQLDFTQYLRG